MQLTARKERPHPGAQLRFTDLDGLRLTCIATNAKGGRLADLELRHRRRARCEDRIRNARDTGRHRLRFTTRWPWTDEVTRAIDRLNALPSPG
ncbi:hypothetical protein J1C73_15640 [Streptomyces laculatispora]|nr:hypothetical protein [Streptomyces laculatispora]